jgi:hypothetical protein
MALMTLAVAAPSVFAATHVIGMRRWIRIGSGALSLCFGLWLAHRIGFTDGLFTGAPRWTPE